jgi:large subunit ribosomal protein L24
MANSRSTQPRKQRRVAFNASSFDRHRQLAVSLSRELRLRYKRRALPLRKGDTIRIISGKFKGTEDRRVSEVDMRTLRVTLDGVTIKKVDQKLKPLPIRVNNLILTRLNLADPWRRKILNVSAAEVPPEETPPVEPEATPEPAATGASESLEETDAEDEEEPSPPSSEIAGDEAPAPAAPRKRKAKPAKKESA